MFVRSVGACKLGTLNGFEGCLISLELKFWRSNFVELTFLLFPERDSHRCYHQSDRYRFDGSWRCESDHFWKIYDRRCKLKFFWFWKLKNWIFIPLSSTPTRPMEPRSTRCLLCTTVRSTPCPFLIWSLLSSMESLQLCSSTATVSASPSFTGPSSLLW